MRYVGLGLVGLIVGYVVGIILAIAIGTIVGDGFGQIGRYIAFTGAGVGAVAGVLIAGRGRPGQGS